MGKSAIQKEIFKDLNNLLGAASPEFLRSTVQNVNEQGAGTMALIISTITLILSATGIFFQLILFLGPILLTSHVLISSVAATAKSLADQLSKIGTFLFRLLIYLSHC